jgi:type II secretory pathway pseudopilin PulG
MKVKSESGFTYIDVMIAIVILTVGILALLSAITGAVFQTRAQEQQLNAKQIVTSTMESIMSVKETIKDSTDPTLLGWNKVGNVGSNPNGSGGFSGIFLTGFQPVRINAGPDEVVGTGDDTGTVVEGYQRRILITDECDPDRPSSNCTPVPTNPFPVKVRSVEITVTYFVGSIQRQEVLTTVLTDYAVAD